MFIFHSFSSSLIFINSKNCPSFLLKVPKWLFNTGCLVLNMITLRQSNNNNNNNNNMLTRSRRTRIGDQRKGHIDPEKPSQNNCTKHLQTYKLFQNVQNIGWSHKLYRENHGNQESRIDSRRKKLTWSKDPESYIPGRCTINIIICKSDDATKQHTQEIHRRKQTYQIARKDQSSNLHGQRQTICKKRKRIGNPNTGQWDI